MVWEHVAGEVQVVVPVEPPAKRAKPEKEETQETLIKEEKVAQMERSSDPTALLCGELRVQMVG